MSRHQTERNQFNRRIKPDSRFAPLPHEGEVRNEEEPCLTTPKDACGVLERFSRSSKQVLSGTENVGSVFRIMRRAEDAPAVAAAAPARRPPATAATLKHVIVGADGKPLPPSPARDRSRSRSRSRSRGRRRDRSRDRRRGRRRRDDDDRRERSRSRRQDGGRRRDDEDRRERRRDDEDRRERSRGRARHRRSRERSHERRGPRDRGFILPRDRRRSYS